MEFPTPGETLPVESESAVFYRSVVFIVWDLPRRQPEGNQYGKANFTGALGTGQKMPVVRQSHHKCRFVI